MASALRGRLTYTNVGVTIALILAVSGFAIAAVPSERLKRQPSDITAAVRSGVRFAQGTRVATSSTQRRSTRRDDRSPTA